MGGNAANRLARADVAGEVVRLVHDGEAVALRLLDAAADGQALPPVRLLDADLERAALKGRDEQRTRGRP